MEDDIREQLRAQRYPEAFDRLLQHFKEKVFHLAISILRNESQAEDAAQDVFLRIWKGLPGYDGRASLSTWVYAITRNTCLTELKNRNTHRAVSMQEPGIEGAVDQMPALDSADTNRSAKLDVDAVLDALPAKYRRVVILFYLEQKAYEEVSTMLNLPLGTVKTLLFRAKKELLKIGSRRPRLLAVPKTEPDSIPRTRAPDVHSAPMQPQRPAPIFLL